MNYAHLDSESRIQNFIIDVHDDYHDPDYNLHHSTGQPMNNRKHAKKSTKLFNEAPRQNTYDSPDSNSDSNITTEVNNRDASYNYNINRNSIEGFSEDDILARSPLSRYQRLKKIIQKYFGFIGPGLMVSVAYMDPGNYSTAVAGGAAHQYKLLFSVLLANLLAVFLQVLCAKLGAVTGLDLAQNCREHLPKRLNITIYVLAEIAIIATDLAEVVGTAISLNILFGIPLIFGVVLTVIDVLIVLMAYRPNGPLKIVRIFEGFVSVLVLATVICFAVELFNVSEQITTKDVLVGFLPSTDVFEGDGLWLSLAILGATVMPHSLYLGSGLVQPRLKDYDIKHGNYIPPAEITDDQAVVYKPSMDAINDTMIYTIVELVLSLFTVALFVNAAILIIAGATLSNSEDSKGADLFTIYNLLSNHLSKSAGMVFALALLCSGQSAGVVCTLSGQMVSEGFLHWKLPPALRRILTRAVAITPCLILVLVAGRKGLAGALNASQVVLSMLLPIVSAPLIYFTCSKKIMKVSLNSNVNNVSRAINLSRLNAEDETEGLMEDETLPPDFDTEVFKDMSNSAVTTFLAILVWSLITILNMYLLFNFAIGKDIPM